jgi:hypothetical protein
MPPISSSQMLMYLPWLILIYLTYIAYGLKAKILCTYRRTDRTKIEKWATPNQSRIEFEGGWYQVEPARTVIQWKALLGFFPVPVRALDFRHGSSRALDPSTFNSDFTAEERKQLDRTDNLLGLQTASQQATKGNRKSGMLEQYLPYIMLAGFVILGYFVFQVSAKADKIGFGQNVIQQQLGKIINSQP